MEGHLFNEFNLLTENRWGPFFRKTAVWGRPRVKPALSLCEGVLEFRITELQVVTQV